MSDSDEVARRALEVGKTVPEQYPTQADISREWLWWHVEKQRWRRVELLEVPAGKARRVKIQHLDDDMEGRAAWSPLGRCRVPWAHRTGYIDSWERFARAVSRPFDRDTRDAAAQILQELVPGDLAFLGFKPGGTVEVSDPAGLSSMTGMPVADLLGHPDTFRDDDGWLLPWPVAEKIARSVAARNPLAVVRAVTEEEAEVRPRIERTIDAEIESGRDDLRHIPEKEIEGMVRKSLNRTERKRAIMMAWAGGSHPDLASEYLALLRQHRQLADLAEAALPLLRARKTKSSAELAHDIEVAVAHSRTEPLPPRAHTERG